MGIELPPELRDVAAKVGLRWPEADEDAMRESATAWRETASSIDSLSSSADGVAEGALASLQGASGDAAGREWKGVIGEDGPLRSSAKACTASADRLDHAAEQIGAAKVQMVRQLVDAAKQIDAAEQAAGSGNSQALAGLDTVVRGASVGLSETHAALSSAVDADSGVTMDSGSTPRPLGSVGNAVSEVSGGASGLAADMGTAVGGAGESVGDVAETVGGAANGLPESIPGQGVPGVAEGAAETVGGAVGAVSEPARDAAGAAESTMDNLDPGSGQGLGPPANGSPGLGENTGPISVGPSATPGWGGGPDSTGPVSIPSRDPVTSPHGVQSAWAAPPPSGTAAGAGAPMPPQAPPPSQPPPPAGGFQHGGAAPPPAAGQQPGGVAAQPPPRPAAPHRPQQPGFGIVPQAPPQQPAPQVQQAPRSAAPPPVAAPQPPAPPAHPGAQQPEMQRPPRTPARSEAVVAFVLNQFPLGHMPVAAPRPSRQLPLPSGGEAAEGVCFPPQDHPRSSLVDGSDALPRNRSGAEPFVDGAPREVPDELMENYDTLGELSEVEWERRFLVEGSHDYVWRASARFPEGCVESGAPVVLAPDTVLDRFGTGAGRVFAADGNAVAQRSIPPAHVDREYRRYRVLRPLPVWQGVSASWFAQPGGGVRYRSTYSAAELVAFGYLLELTPEVENSEVGTVRIVVEDLEASQRKEHE